MLLYTTLLDIKGSLTKDRLIELILKSIPDIRNKGHILPAIKQNGQYDIISGDDRHWIRIKEYRKEGILAVRYENYGKNGIIWDLDIITNFREKKIAVRSDKCCFDIPEIVNRKHACPYLVQLLIEHGYLKKDGSLPVSGQPFFMDKGSLGIIKDLVNGKSKYKLPVIYVSKLFSNENPVNIRKMAQQLKGLAHVVVQKNCGSNHRLRDICDGKNEYAGAVGVYFPGPAAIHKRFPYETAGRRDGHLCEKVIRLIWQYSISQKADPLYTWEGIENAVLKEKLDMQKKKYAHSEEKLGNALLELLELKENMDKEKKSMRQTALENAKNEADKILDGFEDNMKNLQEQVSRLSRANDILTCENHGLKAKLETAGKRPLLYLGSEKEFYPGEIKEMVLDAVEDQLKGMSQNTRRSDVLCDILAANAHEHIREKKITQMKNLLKDYKEMSSTVRQELQDLGFTITEEGKHYRVTYYDDERYKTTMAKTGSDRREGRNICLYLLKNMM